MSVEIVIRETEEEVTRKYPTIDAENVCLLIAHPMRQEGRLPRLRQEDGRGG
jgi:hypothetical protein